MNELKGSNLYAPMIALNAAILKNSTINSSIKRCAIAKLALELINRINTMNFPIDILEKYPLAFSRLAEFLTQEELQSNDYDEDFYLKDSRLVLAASVPCGAQVVDLISNTGWKYVLQQMGSRHFRGFISSFIDMCKSEGWYRIHTEPRYLEEFNQEGWNKCYSGIAALLEKNTHIKGVIGTSWFFDPQLINISPRLGYLQTVPINGGAAMVRNGPGKIHTQRATATSKTRRALYEEGKYKPVCYSIVWPRDKLLDWNKQYLASL